MKINNYHLRKWQNVNWVRKLSYVSWINQQLKLIKTRYGSKMHSMYNLCDWIYHFSSQFSFLKFSFFWESHKNLELSSTCFDIYLVNQLICQNNWKITAKFCGLLRKAELYHKQRNSERLRPHCASA